MIVTCYEKISRSFLSFSLCRLRLVCPHLYFSLEVSVDLPTIWISGVRVWRTCQFKQTPYGQVLFRGQTDIEGFRGLMLFTVGFEIRKTRQRNCEPWYYLSIFVLGEQLYFNRPTCVCIDQGMPLTLWYGRSCSSGWSVNLFIWARATWRLWPVDIYDWVMSMARYNVYDRGIPDQWVHIF